MLSVYIGIVSLVFYLGYNYVKKKKYNLPPGPRGLPFIGNVHQLNPTKAHHTICEWQKQYGDIFRMKVKCLIYQQKMLLMILVNGNISNKLFY